MENKHKLFEEYSYENLWLTSHFPARAIDRVKEFDLSGDVLVSSYPKTGSTWLDEIVWLVANNGDIQGARKTPILKRVNVLELERDDQSSIDQLSTESHPRLIKTHLPARFFQKQLEKDSAKIIVLIRNPKDTLVSFFHFYRMARDMGTFRGTWDEFFELYKEKHLFYGDYFDWYMEWVPYLDRPNVKLIRYEDMKRNLRDSIKSIAAFLGKCLSDTQLDEMVIHLHFDSMKDNKMTNYDFLPSFKQNISPFMRKGIVGDWKNYFNQEQSKLVDAKYRDTLAKSGVTLEFE